MSNNLWNLNAFSLNSKWFNIHLGINEHVDKRRYSGMQARLRAINPLPFYIPSTTHSLNLVGLSAVDCCTDAVSLFGFVQELYTFLSVSTQRWSILSDCLGPKELTAKSLSKTRWSARPELTLLRLSVANTIQSGQHYHKLVQAASRNGTTWHEAKSRIIDGIFRNCVPLWVLEPYSLTLQWHKH